MFALISRLFRRGPVVKKGTTIVMERLPGRGYTEVVYEERFPEVSAKGPLYHWDRLVLADPGRRAWTELPLDEKTARRHVDADMQLEVAKLDAQGNPVYRYTLRRDLRLPA